MKHSEAFTVTRNLNPKRNSKKALLGGLIVIGLMGTILVMSNASLADQVTSARFLTESRYSEKEQSFM